MLLAGGVSIILGLAFVIAASGGEPRLNMLSIYGATGGIDFLIESWLLARRRRRVAAVPA
jgi:hypothetical protein